MRQSHNTANETFWTMILPNEAGPGVEMGIHLSRHGIRIGNEMLSWDEIDAARERLRIGPLMSAFKPGERVAHISMGDGTVRGFEDGCLVVDFDDGRLVGRYDERWFKEHPRFLFHRTD